MRKTLSTALLVLGLVVIATGAQAARQDNDGFLYGTTREGGAFGGGTVFSMGGDDTLVVVRHLGATEFGSRKGCSIIAMKQWLGHSASSSMADRYMKPVPPEHRKLIEWVRETLLGPPYRKRA